MGLCLASSCSSQAAQTASSFSSCVRFQVNYCHLPDLGLSLPWITKQGCDVVSPSFHYRNNPCVRDSWVEGSISFPHLLRHMFHRKLLHAPGRTLSATLEGRCGSCLTSGLWAEGAMSYFMHWQYENKQTWTGALCPNSGFPQSMEPCWGGSWSVPSSQTTAVSAHPSNSANSTSCLFHCSSLYGVSSLGRNFNQTWLRSAEKHEEVITNTNLQPPGVPPSSSLFA